MIKGYGSTSRKKSTAEDGAAEPKGANSLEWPKTLSKNHGDTHNTSMMDTQSAYRCSAKPVESRRTGLALSPMGSPRRSGGTLISHRETRVGDSRLRDTGITKILQWNAEGLQHKKTALTSLLQKEKIDIACIQETHLTENIRCTIRGYQVFRKDRKEKHKGGVIVFVKNDIAANEITTDDSLEILAVKFTKNKTQYTIYNCYSPPTENLTLRDIKAEDECFIVLGDFNSHSPSWGYKDLNNKGEDLENWMTDNNLQLLMNEDDPDTYLSRVWMTTSTPDLALMTEDLIRKTTRLVKEQLAGSDHRPILLEIKENTSNKDKPSPPPRWNYKKANWAEFSKLTDSYTYGINCKAKKIDKSTKEFTRAILKAAKETIPRGSRRDYCAGWTKELILLNKQVTELREKVENNPNEEIIGKLKTAEANLRKEIIQSKRRAWHEKTEQLDYDRDGKKLWNIVKSLNGQGNEYAAPSVEDEHGNILNKQQAANCFIRQYKSVGDIIIKPHRKKEVHRQLRKIKEEDAMRKPSDEIMMNKITKYEVNNALKTLKMNKAPGPDNITNNMLKHLGESSKRKLKHLFNASWKQGRLPQIWKQATMIPIKKEGKPKNKAESYRPISLTSCLGKLMERIINRRLLWYLEFNKIISNEQAGFRQFRCTEDQITYIAQQIEDGFQQKQHTATIWVDMEKAFDKVWTKGLLLKLRRANVSHNMFSWIKNYLSNRKARVQSQNYKSKVTNIKNGVPQGGVLSPTLFLLFINDICETKCNRVNGAMYADDMALVCSEEKIGVAQARLQMTLDQLNKWMEDWGMTINVSKTTYTIFSLSTKKQSMKLMLDGHTLKEDPAPKYLGITFDPRLTWKHQIEECQKKGLKRMQLLRKLAGTSWGANTKVLKTTYLGYVKPALEYGITAWGTCSNTQINKVEKVQNQCLRMITGGMRTTPIHTMEGYTGIKSISDQRDEKVLTHYAKMKFMETQALHPKTKRRNTNRLKRNNFITMGQKLETIHRVSPTKEIIKIETPNNKSLPWKSPHKSITVNRRGKFNCKEEIQRTIDTWYPQKKYVRIYTDGAITGPQKNGGAGVLIQWRDKNETMISSPVGTRCTAYRAEEEAILAGIHEIARDNSQYNKNIVFLTDSDDVLQAIESPKETSASNITQALVTLENKITFQWIPGHAGIKGNETADQLAKKGALLNQPEPYTSFPQQKALIKQTLKQAWNSSHKEYNKTDNIHFLQRSNQVTIFRLRTGHNKLKQHMHRLGIANSPYCSCETGYENARHILMDCPQYSEIRKQYWPTNTTLDTKLYGEAEDLRRTADFIADIGLQP